MTWRKLLVKFLMQRWLIPAIQRKAIIFNGSLEDGNVALLIIVLVEIITAR